MIQWEKPDDEPLRRCIRWAIVGAGIGLLVFILYSTPTAPMAGGLLGYGLGWLFGDDEEVD